MERSAVFFALLNRCLGHLIGKGGPPRKVQGDDSLQAKLKAAADSDAVVSIAKEAGFSISADYLKNAQSEISDEELEGVAGGENSLDPCQWTNRNLGCWTLLCA